MSSNTTNMLGAGNLTVRITMLSDWHVGSGAGRPGSVDRLVARDQDGLPYVPAKTLTGLWRDACEQLAAALDEGQERPGWTDWVDHLFGGQPALSEAASPTLPRPAALSVRPARLSADMRAALAGSSRQALRDALCFVKAGVKIDAASGRAEDNHLRFIEMARQGAELTAECQLAESADSDAALAFLAGGLALLERLGASRRRGAGRCKCELAGGLTAAAIRETLRKSAPPVPQAESLTAARPAVTGDTTAEWVSIPLRLAVREKLLVAASTVGNVVEGLDYIPGTLLLPHVNSCLRRLGLDVREAVARGELIVLPATLEIGGERGRPVPFALSQEKEPAAVGAPRRLRSAADTAAEELTWKALRDGYLGAFDGEHLPRHERPRFVLSTHNTVDDDEQRPNAAVGGVFSYQAMAAGTVLRSELRLHISLATQLADAAPRWWQQLAADVGVGRSKKDDYGLVSVTVGAAPAPLPPSGGSAGTLTVWLLSDTLLRGPRQGYEPTAERLGIVLGEALGVTLTPVEAAVRVRRLESWQVAWALPRPSLVGLAAGSCVRFEASGPVEPGCLASALAAGVGERRAEGYGQFAVDDPLLVSPLMGLQPPPEAVAVADHAPARAVGAFAELVELEACRQAIQLAALRVAGADNWRAKHLKWTRSGPPQSQLGALREVCALLDGLDGPGQRRLMAWLKHLKGVSNRAGKWPSGSIAVLESLLTSPTLIWDWLPLGDLPSITAAGSDGCRQALWAEAVRCLLDAAMRAHARGREEEARHGSS